MRRALPVILMMVIVLACVGRDAAADAVRLHGSTIPLRGCRLQDIKAGRLHFQDATGRRQWRELDEVAALGFDGLEALDEAERRIAAGDSAGGVHKLLQALLEADTGLAQVWVRVRLVRTHDARGEFVQAAGHAAAVYMLREDTYWRYLEPVSKPDEPSYAAALESMNILSEASRSLINGDLEAVVRRLQAQVALVHERLAAQVPDRPTGPTLSGIPIDEIRGDALPAALRRAREPAVEAAPAPPGEVAPPPVSAGSRPGGPPPGEPAAIADAAPAPAPAPAPVGRPAASAAPEAIDALLAERRYEEAVAVCDEVAARPGSRSVSRFLHQYGLALAGAGRPRDAAVVHMQGAVLYEASVFAAPSLLETAIIYRDEYRNPQTARRLVEMALGLSSADRAEVAERARDILDTLGPRPLPGSGEG